MIKSDWIELETPEHFSFAECHSFLDRGFDDCMYVLADQQISRLHQFQDEMGLIVIKYKDDILKIQLVKETLLDQDIKEARAFVLEWLDLERDIAPFYKKLDDFSSLSHLKGDYYGSRLVGIPNLFEAICWAIIGQQINLKFAYQVKRSLVEKYGESTTVDGQIYYLFPSPKRILSVPREVFVEMKFSRQKIAYIQNVSQAFTDGRISKSILMNCSDRDEMIDMLCSIKGIGLWTSNYVLMKCLRDPSSIAYGDTGLNKALHTILGFDKRPKREEVDQLFTNFKGWESYLNFYLWKSLV